MGLLHKRNSDSPSNIVTNLEERLPFRNDLSHSLHGYIKTLNGKNVTIEARYFDSRSGESLFTVSMEDSVNGDNIWIADNNKEQLNNCPEEWKKSHTYVRDERVVKNFLKI